MRISIVSRPDDAPGYQIRLAAQLRSLLPEAILEDRITKTTDLVIVLIGPAWSKSAPDAETVTRVEQALGAARVVPVLVQNGRIPPASLIPGHLQTFILHSAPELRHASFAADVERMLNDIRIERNGPWDSTENAGLLRIVSKNPGAIRRMIGKADYTGPVNIKVDEITVGTMHLFGDDMSVPLTAGSHELLMRWRFEKPVEIVVPASGTVVVRVSRNIITGGVRINELAA